MELIYLKIVNRPKKEQNSKYKYIYVYIFKSVYYVNEIGFKKKRKYQNK